MSPHGQGEETTLSQIVADRLELDLNDVLIEYGDTGTCPVGQGTFGSRGSVVGSALMVKAAAEFLINGKKIATNILGSDSVSYSRGFFFSDKQNRKLS